MHINSSHNHTCFINLHQGLFPISMLRKCNRNVQVNMPFREKVSFKYAKWKCVQISTSPFWAAKTSTRCNAVSCFSFLFMLIHLRVLISKNCVHSPYFHVPDSDLFLPDTTVLLVFIDVVLTLPIEKVGINQIYQHQSQPSTILLILI